jgi:hypothetical protein
MPAIAAQEVLGRNFGLEQVTLLFRINSALADEFPRFLGPNQG